jgi:uncharacterized Zn-finger protein
MSSLDTECQPIIGFIDFDENGKTMINNINIVTNEPAIKPKKEIIYKSIINPSANEKENDDSLFECNICNKKFVKKDYYKRHMLSHEKTFDCHLCSKKFFHNYHLKQHMDFHKEVRDYKCDMCDFTARFKSNLIKHKKTHIKYFDIKTNTYKYL